LQLQTAEIYILCKC